jgi:hypothetical protein
MHTYHAVKIPRNFTSMHSRPNAKISTGILKDVFIYIIYIVGAPFSISWTTRRSTPFVRGCSQSTPFIGRKNDMNTKMASLITQLVRKLELGNCFRF